MLYQSLSLFMLSALALAQTSPAPVVADNQYGAEYSLHLNKGPGPLNGVFDFKAIAQGVLVGFNINGFNVSDETTYTYHIHEKPVPDDGNCNATGEHFDPYHVGATHKCDPTQQDLCQLGDLSGKHGPIVINDSLPAYSVGYSDAFLSTSVEDIAFFANLSIVVHRKRDGYRLQCGNFEMTGQPMFSNGSTQGIGNMSTTSCDSSTAVPLGTGPAVPSTTVSTTLTEDSAASVSITSTLTDPTDYSSPTRGTASSSMSLQTGNYGSGRVEASLIVLGLTAVIPAMFL